MLTRMPQLNQSPPPMRGFPPYPRSSLPRYPTQSSLPSSSITLEYPHYEASLLQLQQLDPLDRRPSNTTAEPSLSTGMAMAVDEGNSQDSGSCFGPNKRLRTARACLRCRLQKVKCSGEIPCHRCTRLKVTCQDAPTASGNHQDHGCKYKLQRFHAFTTVPMQSFSTTERQLHSALRRIAHLEASIDNINGHLHLARTSSSAHKLSSCTGGALVGATAEEPTPPAHTVLQHPVSFSDVISDKQLTKTYHHNRDGSPQDATEDELNATVQLNSLIQTDEPTGSAANQPSASAGDNSVSQQLDMATFVSLLDCTYYSSCGDAR